MEEVKKILAKFKNMEEYEEASEWLDDLSCDYEIDGGESLEDLAYQLTAYEEGGFINFDDFFKTQIEEIVENLEDEELVSFNNDLSNYDDYIYTDLGEMLEGLEPEDVANKIHFGDYHGGVYGFYQFNGYANVIEDTPDNLADIEAITDHLIEEKEPLEEVKSFICKMALELVKNGF